MSPAANAVVAGSTEKVVTAAMTRAAAFLNNLGNFIHYLLLFVCEFLY